MKEAIETVRNHNSQRQLLAQAAFNKPVDWVLATLKRNVDPSLQHCCNWMFRNWIYDTLVFLVTVLTACSLCLEGSLCVPVTGQGLREQLVEFLLDEGTAKGSIHKLRQG